MGLFAMPCGLGAYRRPGRDCDLHDLAAAAREAGEHRVYQARDYHIGSIGLRAGLGAAVEQRRVRACGADVEVDLAMIFDIAVDPAAVPEGVVPAPRIPAAPAPAEAGTVKAPAGAVEPAKAVAAAVERILDVAHLAAI